MALDAAVTPDEAARAAADRAKVLRRGRQLRRRRSGAVVAATALAGGVIFAAAVHAGSAGSSEHVTVGATPLRQSADDAAGRAEVLLRPVECVMPPAAPWAVSVPSISETTCTSPPGTPASTPATADRPSAFVLLPALGTTNRYLLGPADLSYDGVLTVTHDPHGCKLVLHLPASQLQTFELIAGQRHSFYVEGQPGSAPLASLEAVETNGRVLSVLEFPHSDVGPDLPLAPVGQPPSCSQLEAAVTPRD